MERKSVSGIVMILLLASMLSLAFSIQPVKLEPTTWTVDDDGPADFHTIQEAINAANDGDTIFVYSGIYSENVVVNKNVSLIGENRETTIIDGNSTGRVVYVTFTDVRVSNFTIRNGQYGVYVRSWVPNTEITIQGNIICLNEQGIHVTGYNDENTHAYIYNNTIRYNNHGIWAEFYAVTGGVHGNIVGNHISSNNQSGISLLGFVSFSSIHHNNFVNNAQQVYMEGAYVWAWDDGYPSGGNYWSDYTDVDLFSGPSQNESGSDGIWDHPYIIDVDNEDRYPLVRPYGVLHDVAVTSIGFHHYTVYGNITVTTTYNGENVNLIYVDAEISNNGEVPEEVEVTFSYTIADVSTTIGVVFVDVAVGSTEIASVSLDTSGFPVGYLPITVEATEVLNEGNTLDNNMTTTLWIKQVGDVQGDPTDPDPTLGDGDVDRYDAGAMSMAYGWHYGEPRYNVEADFDRDGDVDRYDAGYLAQNYSIILPPYEPL